MPDDQGRSNLVDDHVFLTGRPPLGEYLGFLQTQAVNGQSLDQRQLADEWRAANDHIRELEKSETGIAGNVVLSELPPDLSDLAAAVRSDPMYLRAFSVVPSSIKMVELDRLVVFQKHINLEYVKLLQRSLVLPPDSASVFHLCLPVQHVKPGYQAMRVADNAFVFVSASNDLRFLEPTMIDAGQVSGYSPAGPVSGIVGLVVGFGSNFLNAIHAEDRLVLANGSHRAYALRELGITHVPAIVQHVSRREELPVLGVSELVTNSDLYLKSPRPPLLMDYFDAKLRTVVGCPRRLRQVKVVFGIELLDVPAT